MKELGSSDVSVRAQEFMTDSSSQIMVDISSKPQICFPKTLLGNFFTVWINLSHYLHHQQAVGGLTSIIILISEEKSKIWFQTILVNRRFAPTKLEPFSLEISEGWSLREINLCKLKKKPIVDKLSISSKCTAWYTVHVQIRIKAILAVFK
ncbi:hypothetical protein NPIL_659641 [Nephila pilipes]|uniref:Uncharacterized protein n=1 Tax=Nephila pilipes TaxID=299642 RepID=A0A8X6PRS9_NEPPI|nr:hypothetical protein NPIL_659641 [Nephila pilipes]